VRGRRPAVQWASTLGLAIAILVVSGFFWLGIRGMQTVGQVHTASELARKVRAHPDPHRLRLRGLAHYFSLLAFQGQAAGYLLSDPLGTGSNLFGTAKDTIRLHPRLVEHGLVRAGRGARGGPRMRPDSRPRPSDRAGYPKPREAIRSQYWMLVVMVGFTSLGLWLLSAVRT